MRAPLRGRADQHTTTHHTSSSQRRSLITSSDNCQGQGSVGHSGPRGRQGALGRLLFSVPQTHPQRSAPLTPTVHPKHCSRRRGVVVVEIGPRPLYITLTAVASAPAAAAIVPSTPKRNQHVNVSVPESESPDQKDFDCQNHEHGGNF